MDVAAWLDGLGLGRYAPAFRDNDIDAELLCGLNEADLEKLGVTSLGHRRRLIAAITALGPGQASPGLAETAGAFAPAPREAERRRLTVMFVDLVGSTALSARRDPEETREIVSKYQTCVAREIGRFGGHVAKFMGDGVLAYFGWPRAHEDEAERAVRAGLAIAAAVPGLSMPTAGRLAARVGIATGLVVVGDLVGEGAAQEEAVVGETPNLAARLQELAEPGGVLIGEATCRLVGNLFDLAGLGCVELKGLPQPVAVSRVVGERVGVSRFEAHHARRLPPMAGRDQELALLIERWRRAVAGEGQAVLLVGEPGIGKSRIAAALAEAVQREDRVVLRYQCSPQHSDSPLWPVTQQLAVAAGFATTNPSERLARLDALLRRDVPEPGEALPLLAELLGLPGGPSPDLTPQQKRARTLAALVAQLIGLSRRRSVLVLFEDVHWIDPTSLELIEQALEAISAARVLFLLTSRPDGQPAFGAHPHLTRITLSRLGRAAAEAIVARLAAGRALASSVQAEILARTDGVPLFIEELTKAILEAEADAPGESVPGSLHDSLMARLDRVPGAKEVAQVAACIGREFSHPLLAVVTALPEAMLLTALERLASAELVFRRGDPPDATYTFKHALVRDAARESLLKSQRRHLHARIAAALEEHFPEWAGREPELVAQHCAEAQQTERAVAYWLKAGERAAGRSANLEAISHLTKGLEALAVLPESTERDRRELALRLAIGTPLIAVRGYAAPETGAAFARARALCERLGEAEPLVATLSGEFVFHFVLGDHGMMRRLVDEIRRVGGRMPDPVVRLAGHRVAGITAMHAGALAEARSEFEAILSAYDPRRHRSLPVHYVHDPQVSALTYLAPVLWLMGFPEQARRSAAAAFECAAELDQANLMAHVRCFAGAGLEELLRALPAVRAQADAIVELADRYSLHYWRLNGRILQGWAMAQEGDVERGVTLMRQSLADRHALGVSWYQVHFLCLLAATHAELAEAAPGLDVVADARRLIARSGEHLWESELDRIEGLLRQVQGAAASDVEACFLRASALSREQGARALELRAAMSLARLWAEQGRQREAHDLLASVYGWFTEGFDTPDLVDAKALLEALA
jgi:predicted ATPase/class 3 adenylate cyclase